MSLIILKPEALSLRKEILGHFSKFKICHQREVHSVSQDQFQRHYQEHLGKPFYANLEKQFVGHPVVVVEFDDVSDESIQEVRKIVGNYSQPESIRGKYGLGGCLNMIHASDSMQSFLREKQIWLTCV
jgi:nucleoside-diphosphate kinase